jgi:putative membrane-bound dehydrogenase-like protein
MRFIQMRTPFAIACAVLLAAAAPQDANLARNPSFETEKAGWPDGWMAAQGHAARDATTAHSGRASLRVTTGGLADYVEQFVALKPNTRCALSLWVRSRDLKASAAGVRFVQTAPSEQVLAATEPVAGTVDWTERRATFTTPAGHANGRLDVHWDLAAGTAWFDDVTLTELGPGDLRPVDANRLTYLDGSDPYYVSGSFPKLVTPQWIGEEGVEAALLFSIDDMKDVAKYEAFLRPLLDRLKKIDGRAPVSIMTCQVDPKDERLQGWLKEGLGLENHTIEHPHPLLRDGDFAKARANVDCGTDLLFEIPNNRPVAFRMPWCDVQNTQSPRFFAEIFNGRTQKGNFLSIDSSVFTFLAPKEKYAKYLTHVPNFVNWVDDYPYPYVIGRLCWEFPGVVPDDSVAQRLNKPDSPETVADLKATLDTVVGKQGAWTLVFHPHNWIKSEQLVELANHAVAKHGAKAKFLTFREAQVRIDRNLLAGHPLRAADGSDNGVRLLDLDNDGFLDVVIGNSKGKKTRLWKPGSKTWMETDFPVDLVESGARFGVIDGRTILFARSEAVSGAWRFDEGRWIADSTLLAGLDGVFTRQNGKDRGVRFRDQDRDGRCELIVGNEVQNAVYSWSPQEKSWKRQAWALPKGTAIVDADGRDAGLRFVDLNKDGFADVVFSNAERYSVHLYIPRPNALRAFPQMGWTRPALIGRRGDPGEIPMIVRGGDHPDNGAWFHSGKLWVQNEDTTKLPDSCEQWTFRDLMVGYLPPPLSPEESLKRIAVRPGFKVELVAAEPLVHDPVAFEWGPDGRLWVVEMLDYPLGIDGKGKPGGVVRVLEDTKGDGHYDKSTVFMENLNFPNGLMPWKKGVLISAVPEVIYAEDTDGDGRADVRTTLLSGFGQGNQQHRANGFVYGLDNWVYGANGGSSGTVLSHVSGRTRNLSGRDFRFRPDDGAFESEPGITEFGRLRDDWGNWFGNNHPTWGWHYWLPDHYLVRNPSLAARGTKRVLGDAELIMRTSPLMARPQMARELNHVTSPSCVSPYRDDLFGPGFAASIFIGEVDKNVVRRFDLSPDGVSFAGRRAPDERDREFLASTDNWFRPTMTKTGPDGALYVADMYRLIIEHQEYYPEDTHDLMDFRAGHDKGRIYRVVPEGATLRKIPRMDRMSTAELVAAMDSPNGWQRDTAQKLLVWGGDKAAAAPLATLARESSRPKARLQALCTLDGLGALKKDLVVSALRDPDAHVREHAVRLSEPFLQTGDAPEGILDLVRDPEIRVRYQLAFTLGEWRDSRAAQALVALAAEKDEAILLAVASSAAPHVATMLPGLARQRSPLVASVVGLADDRDVEKLMQPEAGVYAGWQFEAYGAWLDARRREADPGAPIVTHARAVALDAKAAEADRAAAIGLLRSAPDVEPLAALLDPQVAVPLQRAALGRLKLRAGAGAAMIARWKFCSPAIRGEVLAALFARTEGVQALLDAIEKGGVPPGELDATRQQQLLKHGEAAIRNRAANLFAATNADRRKVVEEYQVVAQLKGDPAKGLLHFRKTCATCHKVRGEGFEVGPDLSRAMDKPVGELLNSLLDPSQTIVAGFTAYRVITKDDRDLSGIIPTETPNSITLRMPNGVEEVLRRDQIRQMAASSLSLMPDGLEKALKPQDVADLLAWLTGGK